MTETKYWPAAERCTGLKEAAAALAEGGVVAFPTETVYGLGADARNTSAVRRIFIAKGRPSDNPLIVHLAHAEHVHRIVGSVNEIESILMAAFWPGPLTLVLPVREGAVSPLVTAGLDTVAVRVPAHDLARELIDACGCPLAAPSANRSGRPSPTLADHVMEDLNGRIDGVLDGGPTGVGLESTVVRVMEGRIHILRPGGVTSEQLREAAGGTAEIVITVNLPNSDAVAPEQETPRAPGMKYAHYAPKGDMLLVTGDFSGIAAAVQGKLAEAKQRHRRVAVLCCTEHAALYDADAVLEYGSRHSPEDAAHSLYSLLRECDELDIDYIVAEGYPETGIGTALMNRLRKAAGGNELTV
ncbi:translation factor [Cohnella kolymensis]|uniref:Threonylcarbamoyl-AMP synthase n=1 Tax=Cohnella kolymensis TaxID=1590652 RepID=A0ABR5A6I3_9BACL|nr:L-threonylcarbamoyladenylate synthase [Cohnella kolymensis]KIL36632.1 translation factor [Cohnella kolymensis]